MWILAREPRLDPAVLEDLLSRARTLGFAVDQLIMVEQGPVERPSAGGA
jgi:apolipoprotein D and lipocalin family protein